jgi:hypothetical protein
MGFEPVDEGLLLLHAASNPAATKKVYSFIIVISFNVYVG